MGEGVSGRHSVLVIFGEGCPSPRPSSTVGSGRVTEILYGLRDSQRERVAALREAGEFFCMDVSLGETSLDDLVEALDLPERAAQALASRGRPGVRRGGSTLTVITSCSARAATSSLRTGQPGPNECVPLRCGCWSVASTC